MLSDILKEKNSKNASLYIYSFTKNKFDDRINNNNNNTIDSDYIDDSFDAEWLELYVYRERNPARINAFEQIFWKFKDSKQIFWQSSDSVRELIHHYFNNENVKKNNKLITLILDDFQSLKKKYYNYQHFLLYDCESFTQRKFMINLTLFMTTADVNDKKNLETTVIRMIVQLWHAMNIDIDVLKNKFIPLAFSKWYKNYPFYSDYFCIIAKEDVKNDFYKSFLTGIVENKNVDDGIETVLKKYSHKMFYINYD